MVAEPQPSIGLRPFSNRMVIISLLVILTCTLFPFEFDFSTAFPAHASRWLLGATPDPTTAGDSLLNILLFIPWGFGISNWLGRHGRRPSTTAILAVCSGAAISYLIESLQLYIPQRNSAWDDVLSNSAGALAGGLLFVRWGGMLRRLSEWEVAAGAWLSPRRIAWMVLVYVGLFLAVSAPLQYRTRLSDWRDDSLLLVGSDVQGQHRWRGRIQSLQFWDRALAEPLALAWTTGKPAVPGDPAALASYDFSPPPPYVDKRGFLAALYPFPDGAVRTGSAGAELDGRAWLSTRVPLGDLTRKMRERNQFTVGLTCSAAAIHGVDGHIVTLGDPSGEMNFRFRQRNADLVFWFRNPVSSGHAILAWEFPRFFATDQARSILVTYDGSVASLYVNGRKAPRSYYLGPGASLAEKLKFVQSSELGAYATLYDALMFIPTGWLLGFAVSRATTRKTATWVLVALGFVFPPLLLEMLLMSVSGRALLPGQVALSLVLTGAGCLLSNADPPLRADGRPPESQPPVGEGGRPGSLRTVRE